MFSTDDPIITGVLIGVGFSATLAIVAVVRGVVAIGQELLDRTNANIDRDLGGDASHTENRHR